MDEGRGRREGGRGKGDGGRGVKKGILILDQLFSSHK